MYWKMFILKLAKSWCYSVRSYWMCSGQTQESETLGRVLSKDLHTGRVKALTYHQKRISGRSSMTQNWGLWKCMFNIDPKQWCQPEERYSGEEKDICSRVSVSFSGALHPIVFIKVYICDLVSSEVAIWMC